MLGCECRISSSSKGRPAVKGIVSEAAAAAIEMLSVNEAVAVKGTARQVHHRPTECLDTGSDEHTGL